MKAREREEKKEKKVRIQIRVYNSSVSYANNKEKMREKNHMNISRTVFVSAHVAWPVRAWSLFCVAILAFATKCFSYSTGVLGDISKTYGCSI